MTVWSVLTVYYEVGLLVGGCLHIEGLRMGIIDKKDHLLIPVLTIIIFAFVWPVIFRREK